MKKSPFDVFIFQRVLPHYRIANFKYLSDALDGKLMIFYDHSLNTNWTATSRDGNRYFESSHLRAVPLFGRRLFYQNILRPLMSFGLPKIIVAEGNSRVLSNYLLVFLKIFGIKIVFWGHGHSMKGKRKGARWRDLSQILLMKLADAYITYSREGASFVRKQCQGEKVFVAPNTIDIATISMVRRNLSRVDRLKDQLSLSKKNYALFIGTLLPAKRVDIVIDKVIMLNKRGMEIGCVIIGDGPMKNDLIKRIPIEYLNCFHFLGQINNLEISAPYIYLTDFYLSPGYIGLSINHCLALGVPAIAEKDTSKVAHSPEIEYLQPGVNGFFSNYSDDEDLFHVVKEIIDNREVYRKNCISYAEMNLTLDNFVNGFLFAFEYLKK